jgi:hypothetical protein
MVHAQTRWMILRAAALEDMAIGMRGKRVMGTGPHRLLDIGIYLVVDECRTEAPSLHFSPHSRLRITPEEHNSAGAASPDSYF